MKNLILIFFIVGLNNCFGQNQVFQTESEIESILNRQKVNLSEPITLKNGLLTTKNIMMGFDGKPVYESEVKIKLKEILEIETEFYEKTNITKLKFISDSENSIQEKYLNSDEFHSLNSSQINLRFINSENLAELLDFFNKYKLNSGIISNYLENETFDSFIHKFSMNEEFQIERIKFPLDYSKRIDFENNDSSLNKSTIPISLWKHQNLNLDKLTRVQIYDNFQKTLKETDERLIDYVQIKDNIDIGLFFKRIKGLWFLIAIENR
ncbi:DUF4348 domain-containing protein [Mariniflexile sp.]|uniref:DUF4348 domain-containing protein n=1 Tax=Mariniflexile sp. TaxID=1979402 RepID=UPI004047C39B